MKLENLHEGQIIQNYRELCGILEIPEFGGNAKSSQLKQLSKSVRFSQQGHKFIILEILSYDIVKINNGLISEKKEKQTYIENISVQLLSYLAKNIQLKFVDGVNYDFLTSEEIAFITGMINPKYKEVKRKISDFLEETNYDFENFELEEFFRRTNVKTRAVIKSALNNLENRHIIIADEKHVIMSGFEKPRIATLEEEGIIQKVKYEVCQEMELKNEGMVFKKRKTREFYDIVNFKLDKLIKDGCTRIYKGWFICFHNSQIKEKIERLKREITELEIATNKLELNSKIHKYLDEQAEVIYKRNKYNIEQFFENEWGNPLRTPPIELNKSFVKNQKIMSEMFIKLKDLN